MFFLKKLFRKEEDIPPMPSWGIVVEMMYDKQLDAFSDEVINVIYSKDKTKRYVVLKDQKGLLTYQFESIYQYDEEEWNYTFSEDCDLPAMWEPFRGDIGKSFFENSDELMREIQTEPEYIKYFE